MAFAVTIDDIEAAAARLAVHGIGPSALRHCGWHGLRLRCEHDQPTGSFKIRGATNALAALPAGPVVAASSGNHGLAVAAAAAATGRHCTVVTTTDITPFKRAALAAAGATIVEGPPGTGARNATAAALAVEQGAVLVPPYDHPLVIAGQGTVGRELARQRDVGAAWDTVVVPVGGGGLLAGTALALRAALGSRVHIVGVEPAAGDDTVRSIAAGRRVTIAPPATICDGARAQSPGELTFPIVQSLVDEVVTVEDDDVRDALDLLADAGERVEPTGALAVAAVRSLDRWRPDRTVCVVTGGNVAP